MQWAEIASGLLDIYKYLFFLIIQKEFVAITVSVLIILSLCFSAYSFQEFKKFIFAIALFAICSPILVFIVFFFLFRHMDATNPAGSFVLAFILMPVIGISSILIVYAVTTFLLSICLQLFLKQIKKTKDENK